QEVIAYRKDVKELIRQLGDTGHGLRELGVAPSREADKAALAPAAHEADAGAACQAARHPGVRNQRDQRVGARASEADAALGDPRAPEVGGQAEDRGGVPEAAEEHDRAPRGHQGNGGRDLVAAAEHHRHRREAAGPQGRGRHRRVRPPPRGPLRGEGQGG
ncbi:unnamed protein product, partial [Prorocentrum cordatum]